MFSRIIGVAWFGLVLSFLISYFCWPLIHGLFLGILTGDLLTWPGLIVLPLAILFLAAGILSFMFFAAMIVRLAKGDH